MKFKEQVAFCVQVGGELITDTTYECEELSKCHYLCFSTGDYDQEVFSSSPGGMSISDEFKKYPQAEVVRVSIQRLEVGFKAQLEESSARFHDSLEVLANSGKGEG